MLPSVITQAKQNYPSANILRDTVIRGNLHVFAENSATSSVSPTAARCQLSVSPVSGQGEALTDVLTIHKDDLHTIQSESGHLALHSSGSECRLKVGSNPWLLLQASKATTTWNTDKFQAGTYLEASLSLLKSPSSEVEFSGGVLKLGSKQHLLQQKTSNQSLQLLSKGPELEVSVKESAAPNAPDYSMLSLQKDVSSLHTDKLQLYAETTKSVELTASNLAVYTPTTNFAGSVAVGSANHLLSNNAADNNNLYIQSTGSKLVHQTKKAETNLPYDALSIGETETVLDSDKLVVKKGAATSIFSADPLSFQIAGSTQIGGSSLSVGAAQHLISDSASSNLEIESKGLSALVRVKQPSGAASSSSVTVLSLSKEAAKVTADKFQVQNATGSAQLFEIDSTAASTKCSVTTAETHLPSLVYIANNLADKHALLNNNADGNNNLRLDSKGTALELAVNANKLADLSADKLAVSTSVAISSVLGRSSTSSSLAIKNSDTSPGTASDRSILFFPLGANGDATSNNPVIRSNDSVVIATGNSIDDNSALTLTTRSSTRSGVCIQPTQTEIAAGASSLVLSPFSSAVTTANGKSLNYPSFEVADTVSGDSTQRSIRFFPRSAVGTATTDNTILTDNMSAIVATGEAADSAVVALTTWSNNKVGMTVDANACTLVGSNNQLTIHRSSGNTFTGAATADSTNASLVVKDSAASGKQFHFIPSVKKDSVQNNDLAVDGEMVILGRGSSPNASTLTLTTNSSTRTGVKIEKDKTTLAGGTQTLVVDGTASTGSVVASTSATSRASNPLFAVKDGNGKGLAVIPLSLSGASVNPLIASDDTALYGTNALTLTLDSTSKRIGSRFSSSATGLYFGTNNLVIDDSGTTITKGTTVDSNQLGLSVKDSTATNPRSLDLIPRCATGATYPAVQTGDNVLLSQNANLVLTKTASTGAVANGLYLDGTNTSLIGGTSTVKVSSAANPSIAGATITADQLLIQKASSNFLSPILSLGTGLQTYQSGFTASFPAANTTVTSGTTNVATIVVSNPCLKEVVAYIPLSFTVTYNNISLDGFNGVQFTIGFSALSASVYKNGVLFNASPTIDSANIASPSVVFRVPYVNSTSTVRYYLGRMQVRFLPDSTSTASTDNYTIRVNFTPSTSQKSYNLTSGNVATGSLTIPTLSFAMSTSVTYASYDGESTNLNQSLFSFTTSFCDVLIYNPLTYITTGFAELNRKYYSSPLLASSKMETHLVNSYIDNLCVANSFVGDPVDYKYVKSALTGSGDIVQSHFMPTGKFAYEIRDGDHVGTFTRFMEVARNSTLFRSTGSTAGNLTLTAEDMVSNGRTNRMCLIPVSTSGGYNPLAQANDSFLLATNSSVNNSVLTLGTWSTTNSGVRITNNSSTVQGGSNSLVVDASAGSTVSGRFRVPDTLQTFDNSISSQTIPEYESTGSTTPSVQGPYTETLTFQVGSITINEPFSKEVTMSVALSGGFKYRNGVANSTVSNLWEMTYNNLSFTISKNGVAWKTGVAFTSKYINQNLVNRIRVAVDTVQQTVRFYLETIDLVFTPDAQTDTTSNVYSVSATVNCTYTLYAYIISSGNTTKTNIALMNSKMFANTSYSNSTFVTITPGVTLTGNNNFDEYTNNDSSSYRVSQVSVNTGSYQFALNAGSTKETQINTAVVNKQVVFGDAVYNNSGFAIYSTQASGSKHLLQRCTNSGWSGQLNNQILVNASNKQRQNSTSFLVLDVTVNSNSSKSLRLRTPVKVYRTGSITQSGTFTITDSLSFIRCYSVQVDSSGNDDSSTLVEGFTEASGQLPWITTNTLTSTGTAGAPCNYTYEQYIGLAYLHFTPTVDVTSSRRYRVYVYCEFSASSAVTSASFGYYFNAATLTPVTPTVTNGSITLSNNQGISNTTTATSILLVRTLNMASGLTVTDNLANMVASELTSRDLCVSNTLHARNVNAYSTLVAYNGASFCNNGGTVFLRGDTRTMDVGDRFNDNYFVQNYLSGTNMTYLHQKNGYYSFVNKNAASNNDKGVYLHPDAALKDHNEMVQAGDTVVLARSVRVGADSQINNQVLTLTTWANTVGGAGVRINKDTTVVRGGNYYYSALASDSDNVFLQMFGNAQVKVDTGRQTSQPAFQVVSRSSTAGAPQRGLYVLPIGASQARNPTTQQDDTVIYATDPSSTNSTVALNLTVDSATKSGVRVTTTGVTVTGGNTTMQVGNAEAKVVGDFAVTGKCKNKYGVYLNDVYRDINVSSQNPYQILNFPVSEYIIFDKELSELTALSPLRLDLPLLDNTANVNAVINIILMSKVSNLRVVNSGYNKLYDKSGNEVTEFRLSPTNIISYKLVASVDKVDSNLFSWTVIDFLSVSSTSSFSSVKINTADTTNTSVYPLYVTGNAVLTGTVVYSGAVVYTKLFTGFDDSISTTLDSEALAQDCTFTPVNTGGFTCNIVCQCFYRWYAGTDGSSYDDDTFEIYLKGNSNDVIDYCRPKYNKNVGGGGREMTRPLCGVVSSSDTTPITFRLYHKRTWGDDNSNIHRKYVRFLVQQIVT